MSARHPPHAAGFTMIEVLIVAALMVPLMLVVGSASKGVIGAIEANDRAADVSNAAVLTLEEVERVLRFGRLGSLEVVATRTDVRAGLAAAVGDWFPMPQRNPRSDIQLLAATGERELALQVPFRQYRLRFVREATELANGRDDDGDGLVDEGELHFTRGATTTKLLDGVELCTFQVDGGSVELTLRYCRTSHGRGIARTTLNHTVHLLNH